MRYAPAALLLLVAAGNCAIGFALFHLGITAHFHSNELSYPSLAKFWWEWRADPYWFPLWDLGMPLQNAYFPIVPWLTACTHALAGSDFVRSFHFLIGIAFAAFPLCFYLLALRLTRSPLAAAVGAALLAFVSTSAILFPEIRADLGSVFHSRRLHTIATYGESPHNFALAFLPLALLAAIHWRDRRRPGQALAWTLAGSFVLLSNPFGAAALAIGVASLLFAARHGPVFAGGLLTPVAVAALFVPPNMVSTILNRSQTSGGDYRFSATTPLKLLAFAICLSLLHWALRRASFESRFVFAFLVLGSAIPAAWYWFGAAIVPQPHRYHLELELAVALAASYALSRALQWRPSLARPVSMVAISACVLLLPIGYAFSVRQLQPRDAAEAPHDALLHWLRQNLPPDARLMVGGELGFAINLFLPNPQLGSGHEPTSPNAMQPIGVYTIYTGQNAGARDAEISILWLKALGAKAIVVPTKKPCEACLQPFQNPAKFEGQLVKLFENDGWRIYSTGLPGHSAFRIVDQSALIRTRPLNGLDIAQIERFVSSLESRPQSLSIHQTSPSHLTVSGSFSPGEVLSFATTYSPGWRASLKSTGVPLPVHRDALDFMYLVPPPGVPCEIEWTYQGAPLGLRLLTLALRTLEIEHVQ